MLLDNEHKQSHVSALNVRKIGEHHFLRVLQSTWVFISFDSHEEFTTRFSEQFSLNTKATQQFAQGMISENKWCCPYCQ